MNYFQPSVKLQEKKRIGSRVRKIYDAPQTALDRLIALGAISQERAVAMLAERAAIDPFALAATIETKVALILTMSTQPPSNLIRHRWQPLLGLSKKSVLRDRAAQGAGKILNGVTVR